MSPYQLFCGGVLVSTAVTILNFCSQCGSLSAVVSHYALSFQGAPNKLFHQIHVQVGVGDVGDFSKQKCQLMFSDAIKTMPIF